MKALVLSITVFCTLNCYAQLSVKTINEYLYDVIDSNNTRHLSNKKIYNTAGLLLEETIYGADFFTLTHQEFAFQSKHVYAYDTAGRITKELFYQNGNNLPNGVTIHSRRLSRSGVMIADTIRSGNTVNCIMIYEYNTAMQVIKTITRLIYPGRIIVPANAFDEWITNEYDANGNIVLVDYAGCHMNRKEHFTFDDKNRLIQYFVTGNVKCGLELVSSTNTYGADGKLIKINECSAMMCWNNIYKYYPNGLTASITSFDEHDRIFSYAVYEYEFY